MNEKLREVEAELTTASALRNRPRSVKGDPRENELQDLRMDVEALRRLLRIYLIGKMEILFDTEKRLKVWSCKKFEN